MAQAFGEHLVVFQNQGVLELLATTAQTASVAADFAPDIIVLLLSRKYLAIGNAHIQKALALYHGPRRPINRR